MSYDDYDGDSDDDWDYRPVIKAGTMSMIHSETFSMRNNKRIYIGDIHSARDIDALQKAGITAIVSLGSDDNDYISYPGIKYFRIKIDDVTRADIYQHFDPACKFIDDHQGNVLVHCHAGVSRSATIVMAYLMKAEKMKYIDVSIIVKRCRPIVCPNFGFQGQLERWSNDLK